MHRLMAHYTERWAPEPDCSSLLRSLRRAGDPARVPMLELFADPPIIAQALDELNPYQLVGPSTQDQSRLAIDQAMRFWHALGYDAIWHEVDLGILRGLTRLVSQDVADLTQPGRVWMNEKAGAITSWSEFETYPWPNPEDADYALLEYAIGRLPEGMGIFAGLPGILESLTWLMGYETLCLALHDQPDLVAAICERLHELVLPAARAVSGLDRVIGIWVGDDMGFKTGTLVSPSHLRRYVLPIHRELAAVAHAHGHPYLLHACGNTFSSGIIDDLIDDVGIDAKHSFEDAILPLDRFVAQYGARVAAIGGVDVDLLASGSPEAVRRRTRQMLEACAPSCAYVLGSGNSIANYIPLANFLAMVDEGRRFNAGL